MTTFAYEMFIKAQEDLKKWKEKGVDPALFWAGRMSGMARKVAYGSISDLSANAELLGLYSQEYDNVIMSREPK